MVFGWDVNVQPSSIFGKVWYMKIIIFWEKSSHEYIIVRIWIHILLSLHWICIISLSETSFIKPIKFIKKQLEMYVSITRCDGRAIAHNRVFMVKLHGQIYLFHKFIHQIYSQTPMFCLILSKSAGELNVSMVNFSRINNNSLLSKDVGIWFRKQDYRGT